MYYGKVITFWIKKQYNTSKILCDLSCYFTFFLVSERNLSHQDFIYTHTHIEISSHNHSETAQWSGSLQDVFSSPLSYQNKHELVLQTALKQTIKQTPTATIFWISSRSFRIMLQSSICSCLSEILPSRSSRCLTEGHCF